MRIYFDSNVLVAAAIESHPHHVEAEAALQAVRAKAIEGYVSAHTLAEVYAVLTRAPLTPPLYPSEAWQILFNNVHPYFEVVTFAADEYWEIIRGAATAGWSGGRIYDVLHIAAARKAGCERIYTFNLRHFRELAPDLAVQIRTPEGTY